MWYNQIMEVIISSSITGILALLSNYFIYLKRSRTDNIEMARREQYQNDRLDAIEKKVDSHNNYAKKFTQTQERITEISTTQKLIQKDIAYIKKEVFDER